MTLGDIVARDWTTPGGPSKLIDVKDMRFPAAALISLLSTGLPTLAGATDTAQPSQTTADGTVQKHVLFLAVDDFTRPYTRLIVDGFQEGILADPSAPVLYFESLDVARFEKNNYLNGLRQWYAYKYASVHLDLIVAIGEDAVPFLARGSGQLWPDTPVLYFDVGQLSVNTSALPLASGILLEDHFTAALGVIKKILPETKRIALVYGASDIERRRFAGFPDKVREAGLDLEPVSLSGVPANRLVQSLNELPEQTAVMLLAPLVDARGQVLASDRPCELLETSANRPVFTQGLQDLGCGVVGGLLRDWSKAGRQIARRALMLLKAPSTDVTIVPIADYTTLAFDARQLGRFGVNEALLPAGSLVSFREPSLWRDHSDLLIAGVLVGILQTTIIAALFAEHRRRRKAELESRQHFVAMAHLDRRAAMGELATSLAHEINQPLNAILHNADAARMMVDANGHAATDGIGEILDDIKKDDLRAAEIIRRMRGLLKKHELERRPVDIKDLALETVKLVSPDAASRDILLEIDLRDGLPPVLGDKVHIQQVLLNLLLNGMDAVAQLPPERRRVSVHTLKNGGHVGLAVRDTGPGITRDQVAKIFEPFFTTKGDGMGMGLAIARSIMDAHDGRIAAENNTNGGATVWFSVPTAAVPAADVR